MVTSVHMSNAYPHKKKSKGLRSSLYVEQRIKSTDQAKGVTILRRFVCSFSNSCMKVISCYQLAKKFFGRLYAFEFNLKVLINPHMLPSNCSWHKSIKMHAVLATYVLQ